MGVTVFHSLTATTPDNTQYEIRPSHWNTNHVASLSLAGSDLSNAFSNSPTVTFGTSGGLMTASVNTAYIPLVNSSSIMPVASSTNFLGTAASGSFIATSVSSSIMPIASSSNFLGSAASGSFIATSNSSLFQQTSATSAITSAAFPSAQTTKFAGTGTTFAGTNISATIGLNSNGLALSLSGNTGGGGGGGIAAAAGSQTQTSGTVLFSNSNGITFGMSNSSVITASHNGLTTAMQSNAGSNFLGTNTALTANGVSVTANSSGLSLNFPVFLTSQSNQAFSASGGSSTFQTLNFANSNGVTFSNSGGSVIATVKTDYLTTAMLSNASTAFAGTGFAGTNITGTHNTAGLSLSVPGTSSISATGAVSISTNGNTISIGAPAMSVGLSNLGNTSGNTGTVSNQFVLAGGNNITLSGSTNAAGMTVTVSANTAAAANLSVSAGTTSGAFGGITFANSNNVTFGLNNGTITASVPTAAAGGVAIANSQTTYTSGTVSFRDGNGITFASGTGQGLSATHALQFTSATSAITSAALNTSQSSVFFQTSASSVFLQTSQSSLFQQTSATSAITSAAFPSAQTTKFAGTGSAFTNLTATFNTAGLSISAPATSSISATGAVSISTSGNTISIGAPAFSAGVTTLGNTSGNTGTVSNQLVLAGGNNITLSGSTNAGGMTLTISGPNIGGAQTGISGLVVSNTTYTSGTVSFRDGNGITFASGTGQGVSLTHGLQFTSATSAITSAALNTSQSSLFQHTSATSAITSAAFPSAQTTKFAGTGTTFSGTNVSGSITLNSNGLNLALSAPAAAGAQTAISGLVVSNTTYTSGTVSFRDGNGITFASGTGQGLSITHGLQFTSATSAITSNALNTSQSSLFFQTSASSVFLQTSQSSLFQHTSATSAITSAAFPSAQTTKFAGTGTTFSGTNVSGSITLNSNGLNLALSAGAGGGGGVAIAASNSTFTSGTVVMSAAGGALTISNGAQSVLFSVPATSSIIAGSGVALSSTSNSIYIYNDFHDIFAPEIVGASTTYLAGQNTLMFAPLFPVDNYSFSCFEINVSFPATSSGVNTQQARQTISYALYKMNTASSSQMSLVSSSSMFIGGSMSSNNSAAFTVNFDNSATSYSTSSNATGLINQIGGRAVVMRMPFNGTMQAGDVYYMGIANSHTFSNASQVLQPVRFYGGIPAGSNNLGYIGPDTYGGSSANMDFMGFFYATSSGAWPSTIATNQTSINSSGFAPYIVFKNLA
jgi:hypothetical protein